jgi:hypothetical protein
VMPGATGRNWPYSSSTDTEVSGITRSELRQHLHCMLGVSSGFWFFQFRPRPMDSGRQGPDACFFGGEGHLGFLLGLLLTMI